MASYYERREQLLRRAVRQIEDGDDKLRLVVDLLEVDEGARQDLDKKVQGLEKRVNALELRIEENEKQILVIDAEELKKTVTAVLGDGDIRYEGLIQQVNELQRRQMVMAIMQSVNLTLSVILVGVLVWVLFGG